jgi:hypothetical protein
MGGEGRFIFGSVADEVTRNATASLLVFHPRADVLSERKVRLTEAPASVVA